MRNESVNAGLDPDKVEAVIQCESQFDKDAVGDHGNSYGLVQIYLPANPSISKEEALDPFFSINFLLTEWKLGRGHLWTCYRLLGYDSP